MKNEILYNKLATLPENLKAEVSNFIDLLLSKTIKDKKMRLPLRQNLEAQKECAK